MSSKKLVYLFMTLLVCGFTLAGTAHGQSKDHINFQGTVTKGDGSSVAGLVLKAVRIDHGTEGDFLVQESTLGADGTYKITFIAFPFPPTPSPNIAAGENIQFTVSDAGTVVHSETYVVKATDLTAASPLVTLDIAIADISVAATPSELEADGTMTSAITVEIGGAAGTGDTVTINAPTKGTVGDVADQGGGVYTATYTAPLDRGISFPETVQITANSANLGRSANTLITLLPIPVTVTVAVGKDSFMADTEETTTVSITVDQAGPVAGATVELALSPEVGSVSAVTDDGGGSYSATYTSGGTTGNVTLTATASGASDSATITINAGPPAAIELSAAHDTVPGLTSTTLTAMVTDINGNAAGAALTAATTSGGTVGDFSSTVFGTYTATYTAPMIDVGTQVAETVTVSTDGISDSVMLNLLGEPPIDVDALEVRGTVYKEDGEIIADGVTVTVTIESNSETDTTGSDGGYGVAFLGFGQTVATTGNTVSVAVDGANVVSLTVNGVAQAGSDVLLLNAILEKVAAGEAITVDVTTDIVIPPRSVDSLSVTGTVFKEDGTTPAGAGLTVEVTVGSQTGTDTTELDGSYGVAFLGFGTPVAASHEIVVVVASDATGERGTNDSEPIRNIELPEAGGHADIIRNVNTDIGLTSISLTVAGTVYLKNGDALVPASSDLMAGKLTVVVTNTTRNVTESRALGDDGTYALAFFNPIVAVAETGDEIRVDVKNEAGETVGSVPHTLGIPDLQAERVEIDVPTTVPAEVRVLHIVGNVIEIDGSPAEMGLPVTIRIDMGGTVLQDVTPTEADGSYSYAFVDLVTPIAATGDILTVDVLRAADQWRGHSGEIYLSSYKLVPTNQPLVVADITLIPPKLELGGLSINTHYTGIQDPIIQQLLSLDLAGLAAAGANTVDPSGSLVMLPPSLPLLISPILATIGAYQLALPAGFDLDDENIAERNFGNAITTRPTAWAAFPVEERHPGRWINGNQLNLYISGAPTIESVTFTLNGVDEPGKQVLEGGSFPYTFQLEEEWIALFSGEMQVFGAVALMIDGHGPVDMTRGDGGVWSADVMLTPGSTVSYYYMVTLSKPYYDPEAGLAVARFPFIDPLNRQVRTDGLSAAIEGLLQSDLLELDPGVRSVFSVPEVTYQESLWVGKFDLDADGMAQLDVNVTYRGTNHEDNITGKTIYVDRTAPTANAALHLDAPGTNAGMYKPAEGYYVATGIMPGAASLTVSAEPHSTENAGYMYQLALLDALGHPGTWNPVVTADLLPLDLEKLLTNPASVIPLTVAPPHRVDMLIRNSQGGGLLGTYGLRTVGIDSLLNMDSARGPDLIVELVPPDPDIVEVSYVQSDFDRNGVIEGLESQSTAGDVVIFSESLVTLVADVVTRTRHPLVSIVLEYQIPGGSWLPIGMIAGDEANALAMGEQLMVPLPVPDIPVLPDRGGHVMLRTTTTNKLNVVHEQVLTAAYQRRTAPEVSAVYATVAEHHPESDAAQGTIRISAFTQAMTNPNATEMHFEVRRSADADWIRLPDVAQIGPDSTVTSHVQISIIEDLINSIISGAPTAPISPLYREWSIAINSATLEDTILDDTPAASDASLDENPWVVRAVAVDMASTEYPAADGIEDRFSVDNYSPTTITTVANEVEMVAPRADGSYYVSGLIHESVPSPMLKLTAWTGAHPNGFTGGIMLAVNDASGTAMEIPATAFEALGNYTYRGVFDLGSIPNGTYTFMAVAHAADGSPETRIDAKAITVEVGNFTPPENFGDPTVDIVRVINTQGNPHSPSEIDAQYTAGLPAVGEEVCATLIVPNVSAGDLDVLIGADLMSALAMGSITITHMPEINELEICVDTSGLDEGIYGLAGLVSKPNGSIQFGLPSIQADRTGPEIAIVSPVERHQVTTLPSIHLTFTDTSGFDVTVTDPMPVVISLTRLADEVEIDITETLIRLTAAPDGEILTRSGDIVYTHDDPVVGGAYRINATVTDALGNMSTATPVDFTVEGVQPTVSIVSPIAGRIVDPRQPLIISVALTGNGDITITEFQINGNDLEGTLENNWLTHTLQPPLVDGDNSVVQRGSDNTISVKIVDSEGRTAEGSASFAVSLDDTAPVISGPSPTGDITRKIGRVTATVTDNESDITRIQFAIDDNPLQDLSFSAGRVVNVGGGTEVQGQTNYNFFDAPLGTHTVTIVAESTGGSTTLNWEFTIVSPDSKPPEVVTYSPLGIIRTDRPILAATVSDESGFARNGITLILAGVPGNQGSGRRSSPTSTTVTFTPSISVTPGPYTARLTVIDRYNNRTEAEWQFTVELDETPPSITTTSPHGLVHIDKPIISASASDDMSGVDSIEITAKDGGGLPVNGITVVRTDKTAANFTPAQSLKDGTYTVDVKVIDKSGNEAAARWQFTVELDLIPPSVLFTQPSQEHTENRRPVISAAYTDDMSGVDADSVKLTLDGSTVKPDDVSETQVVFTPGYDLPFGQHTVTLELSDTAPKANSAVYEWTFYVERIGIADARNYPNPFDDETTIAFRISRQAKISIHVYDFTGRLVATPVSNSVREAGMVEVDWHGTTSAGDHLARGVYFCHILMESELEPQSAILKLAIVAD